jgi:hypothetical protein
VNLMEEKQGVKKDESIDFVIPHFVGHMCP